MRQLLNTVTERNFRGLFRKNFIIILVLLLIVITVIFSILFTTNKKWRWEQLISEASGRMIRIATQTDSILNVMENHAFSINFEQNILDFSKYVGVPLDDQKLRALSRIQNRLASSDGSTTKLLYQANGCYFVTEKTASMVTDASHVMSYVNPCAPYLAMIEKAKWDTLGAKVTCSEESIIFFSRHLTSNAAVFSYVEMPKTNLVSYFRNELAADDFYMGLVDETGANLFCSAPSFFSQIRSPLVTNGVAAPDDEYAIGEKEYYLLSHASMIDGWTYVFFVPTRAIYEDPGVTPIMLAILFCAVVLGSVFISWILSQSLYHPIQIITFLLKNPRKGTMDYYRAYCEKYDDMRLILTLIESSYFQQLAISEELAQQNRSLRRLQNYALAVQMNPHFIFNTLDSINWRIIAAMGNDNEVSSAISDFSKIMRFAMNQEGQVRLLDEVNIGRIYVRLRNTLSDVNFVAIWDIAPELPLDAKVPFLILQPLLENAITHGIGRAKQDGIIRIRCLSKGESLILAVEDNGDGIEEEKLAELRAKLQKKEIPESADHLGIINTHNRIRLTYGEKWGLWIDSTAGKTIVSLHMPLHGAKTIADVKNVPKSIT